MDINPRIDGGGPDPFDPAVPPKEPSAVPPKEPNSANNEELGKAAALALGITETILITFPELKPIFDMFVLGNIAQARLAYFDTNYYKNLTSTAQKRQTQKATQPGVYAQEYDAWKETQKVKLINKGFSLNPDIEAILEESYLKGDSDTQLQIKILNSGKMGRIGGSTLGAVNSLREYAEGQGVNKILPASYWDKVTTAILSDSITVEDVEEEIKGFAISAFPAYATGIQQGRTFGMQTSALRQLIANTLEVDVDTVTNDNAMFKQLSGYLNPKTQTPEIIPLWQAEKIIKNSDQWLYTKNARDTFDTLGLKVLRDWGLA